MESGKVSVMDATNTNWIGASVQLAPHDYTYLANMMVDRLIQNNKEILRISSELLIMRKELLDSKCQNIELKAKIDGVKVQQTHESNDYYVQCVNNDDRMKTNTLISSGVHGTEVIETPEASGINRVDSEYAVHTDNFSNLEANWETNPSLAAGKNHEPKPTKRGRGSQRRRFRRYKSVPIYPVFNNDRRGHRATVIYRFVQCIPRNLHTAHVSKEDDTNDGDDGDDDGDLGNRFTSRVSPSETDGGQVGRML